MNGDNPLVSIIIPVYNGENYIEECINSVRKQTYTKIEIVIINDGSTDLTESICKRFVGDNIILFSTSNQGVSSARNKGLDIATGEFILFVDADDIIDATYVENLLLHHKEVDLVVGGIEIINRDTKQIKTTLKDAMNIPLCGSFGDYYSLLQPNLLGPVAKLYRRDILNKYNIRFPVEYSLAEDQIFNFQYYKYIDTYYYESAAVYQVIDRNESSLSKLRNLKAFEGSVENLKVAYNFYHSRQIKNQKYMYITHALALINKYSYIVDQKNINIEYNTWLKYRERVNKILSCVPITFYVSRRLGLIKNIAWNSIVLLGPTPLMIYCRLKNK